MIVAVSGLDRDGETVMSVRSAGLRGGLVETATAYPELTVVENLDVARRLAGVEDHQRVGLMIDRLALN
jgi:ABC-type multidrug transport system ATPase subunit